VRLVGYLKLYLNIFSQLYLVLSLVRIRLLNTLSNLKDILCAATCPMPIRLQLNAGGELQRHVRNQHGGTQVWRQQEMKQQAERGPTQ
jgi:hypothetical protein